MELGFRPEEQLYAQEALSEWLANDKDALEHVDRMLQQSVGAEIIKCLLEAKEPYVIFVQKVEQEPNSFNYFNKIVKYEVFIKRLNEHNKELLKLGGVR